MSISPRLDWRPKSGRLSSPKCVTAASGLFLLGLAIATCAPVAESKSSPPSSPEDAALSNWLQGLQQEAKAHPSLQDFLPVFDKSLESLGEVGTQPRAQKLRGDLRALLQPASPPPPALGSPWVVGTVAPAGPGSPNPVVTCSQCGYAIPFVLIESPNAPPFYMASIELPVGFAAAAKLLPATNELEIGPQAWPLETAKRNNWAWKSALVSPMTVAIGTVAFYSSENGREFPTGTLTGATPLNAVSGYQAQKIAAALQCTLPTIEQWKAASAERYQAPGVLPRLRGTLWKKQFDHWKGQCQRYYQKTGLLPLGAVPWPDAGSYGASPWKADGSSEEPVIARETDDSSLWFRSTVAHFTRYGYLYDLKGNVAEFVSEGEHFWATGGSALSNPAEWDKPVEVRGTARFSDVGIRLVARAVWPEKGKELTNFSESVRQALAELKKGSTQSVNRR